MLNYQRVTLLNHIQSLGWQENPLINTWACHFRLRRIGVNCSPTTTTTTTTTETNHYTYHWPSLYNHDQLFAPSGFFFSDIQVLKSSPEQIKLMVGLLQKSKSFSTARTAVDPPSKEIHMDKWIRWNPTIKSTNKSQWIPWNSPCPTFDEKQWNSSWNPMKIITLW